MCKNINWVNKYGAGHVHTKDHKQKAYWEIRLVSDIVIHLMWVGKIHDENRIKDKQKKKDDHFRLNMDINELFPSNPIQKTVLKINLSWTIEKLFSD